MTLATTSHKTLPILASGIFTFAVSMTTVQAQAIPVPNFSFEMQVAPQSDPFVTVFVDSWEKNPEPAYYGPLFGAFVPWYGTTGVFFDTNPYTNHVGIQAGYLLAAPQVALFQDYNSTPTHDFDATFQTGKAYQLTIGVFGKPNLIPGTTLLMSLYYRDALNNKVPVAATPVIYSTATFPTSGPLSLIDYTVNVPGVQATDPWAGKKIGIQLESAIPIELTSLGNWDFDNVRLTASNVPEPATTGLLILGLGGLLLRRVRRENLA